MLCLRGAIVESLPEEPTAMSVKYPLALGDDEAVMGDGDVNAKRRRFDHCFSFMEISMEPGSSLKDMDSNKLKAEIKRWAKAVVTYARQHADETSSGSEGETNSLGLLQCYVYIFSFFSFWIHSM
ncbi:hypothetical protein PVL29_011287 [Vitis rotundifolia]|uniref:Uncharacterized protein n=1 Tax=Vitis rotundifolia TaxID=103349 RepID=A0AA39DS21_VITRO|nr:hypothetical protein PVL29_011287 [Vitis rotundifolia]